MRQLAQLAEELDACGVVLRSATEPFDTGSPAGRLSGCLARHLGASTAASKGGTYHYYACTARQKYGPKACRGERVPREKLETAVLHQLTSIYRDGPLIHDALAAAQQQTQHERPALDERRRAIATEIANIERSTERYFEAFEQGRLSPERCEQRVTRLHDRLEGLRHRLYALERSRTAECRSN